MKQGALRFPNRTPSKDAAKAAGERVKDGIRNALALVKPNVRLRGDVADMVRDFTRGRQASGDVALACIAAVVPNLNYDNQVAFVQSLLLSIAEAPLHVLGGSVAHSWSEQTRCQAEADIAQQRALQTGHPRDMEEAERKTLADAVSSNVLAMKFRAARAMSGQLAAGARA